MNELTNISLEDFQFIFDKLNLNIEEIRSYSILYTIKENWVEIVGEGYATYTYPFQVKNDILIILISHDMYKMELEFKKTLIINKINSLIKKNFITKLSYKHGQIPQKKSKNYLQNSTPRGNPNLYKLIPENENELTKQKLKELIDLF